jgi:hypothetical protein
VRSGCWVNAHSPSNDVSVIKRTRTRGKWKGLIADLSSDGAGIDEGARTLGELRQLSVEAAGESGEEGGYIIQWCRFYTHFISHFPSVIVRVWEADIVFEIVVDSTIELILQKQGRRRLVSPT